MASKNKSQTSAKMIFRQYTKEISGFILNNYITTPYLTVDDICNRWHKLIPFDSKLADKILLQSKVFIRPQGSHEEECRDADFLKSLALKISQYLSFYFEMDPAAATKRDARENLEKNLINHVKGISELMNKKRIDRKNAKLEKRFKKNYNTNDINQAAAAFAKVKSTSIGFVSKNKNNHK